MYNKNDDGNYILMNCPKYKNCTGKYLYMQKISDDFICKIFDHHWFKKNSGYRSGNFDYVNVNLIDR